ncbi:PREDICTED: bactericidal permeability-increasing protein-like [Thamnophis sirtalis]|uniref:Bactericidal permeability-increasing protein n=1 Tax=Thamnophis sirtalis TaxID=35019 RepID=A0A6I9XE83_9SAUR|nr:PREDICTED: bactericidal permeability-increasing protein-like [Thamnophis sirtalis]
MAMHAPPTPYDPVTKHWDSYMLRFDCFLEANDRKKNMFLRYCGWEVFDTAKDLSELTPLQSVAWSVLQQMLRTHYASKPSKHICRHEFNIRNQKKYESINAYVAALPRPGFLHDINHFGCNPCLRLISEDLISEQKGSSSLMPLLCCLSLPPPTVTANIDRTSSIDYSLVGPPVATSDCVDLDLKGEFFSNVHRSPAPFPPPPLSFPVDQERMVQFGISTYFFNTAGDVYYKAGALTFWMVDEMVPQEIKIRLNTSSFQPFIPQLKTLYPNLAMKLKLSPSSAPSLSIAPESLSLAASVDIQAFAILPNSSLAPLFLIGVSSPVSAQVSVNSTRISGSLKLGRLKFSLKHSDVGVFSVQMLEYLINFLTTSILIPQMNGKDITGSYIQQAEHMVDKPCESCFSQRLIERDCAAVRLLLPNAETRQGETQPGMKEKFPGREDNYLEGRCSITGGF